MTEPTAEQKVVDPLDNWQQMLEALSEPSTPLLLPPSSPLQLQHKSAMKRYQQRCGDHGYRYAEHGVERAKFRLRKHCRKCKTCRKLGCKLIHDLRRHLSRRNKRKRAMQRQMASAQANPVSCQ